MLIEILRAGSPELARRWLAALMLVPDNEREQIVALIEQFIVREYVAPSADSQPSQADPAPQQFNVVLPPEQRPGYVEQIVKTYQRTTPSSGSKSRKGAG